MNYNYVVGCSNDIGWKSMKKTYKTIAAIVVAVIMILIGILQGQNQSVLAKAIRICLECVGIG